MVKHQHDLGVRFAWVGADGGYGKEPAFLRGLEEMNETFVVDVHKDQLIYLDDPDPIIPPKKSPKGRTRTKLQRSRRLTGVATRCVTAPKVS